MTDHFGDLGDFRCGIVPRMDVPMLSNLIFQGLRCIFQILNCKNMFRDLKLEYSSVKNVRDRPPELMMSKLLRSTTLETVDRSCVYNDQCYLCQSQVWSIGLGYDLEYSDGWLWSALVTLLDHLNSLSCKTGGVKIERMNDSSFCKYM
jgi:hypothetical protein